MKRVLVGSLLAAACLAAAIPALVASGEPAGKAQPGKLRHVVLFKFKDGTPAEDVRKIEDAFRALPKKVPQIIEFEWGMDCSVEGISQGFTHCFLVTFKNEKARAVYLPHPAHKEFVTLLKPHLDKVLVVDYVARK